MSVFLVLCAVELRPAVLNTNLNDFPCLWIISSGSRAELRNWSFSATVKINLRESPPPQDLRASRDQTFVPVASTQRTLYPHLSLLCLRRILFRQSSNLLFSPSLARILS
jgi:hypothetical protein